MFKITGKYTEASIMIDDVEESCIGQITQFVNHLAFTNKVSIMPDTHAGKGSVIGFTMELPPDKIIPNVVGVDINCGMLAINIGKTLFVSLEEIDRKIRDRVPFGQKVHDRPVLNFEKEFPWKMVNVNKDKFLNAYNEKYGSCGCNVTYNMDWFLKKCDSTGSDIKRIINSIGTLGGGNHFIEIGKSVNTDDCWIVIHTGSRNLGKRFCEYWQHKAEKHFEKSFVDQKEIEIENAKKIFQGKELFKEIQEIKNKYRIGINVNGLEWLETDNYFGYLFDMLFAQTYAYLNRLYISKIIIDILKVKPIDSIETVHNFIDFRDFIIRKGAIRSYENERMIIPFNMQTGSLICKGKSNSEWNYSAPHGAGRILSRSDAKRKLDVNVYREQMKNIFSTSVGLSTLDEAPGAYKDPEIIEMAIEPTATILDRIIPIHNMKDGQGSRED
jgi:RNA-splicing ligase RtcB